MNCLAFLPLRASSRFSLPSLILVSFSISLLSSCCLFSAALRASSPSLIESAYELSWRTKSGRGVSIRLRNSLLKLPGCGAPPMLTPRLCPRGGYSEALDMLRPSLVTMRGARCECEALLRVELLMVLVV